MLKREIVALYFSPLIIQGKKIRAPPKLLSLMPLFSLNIFINFQIS